VKADKLAISYKKGNIKCLYVELLHMDKRNHVRLVRDFSFGVYQQDIVLKRRLI
jgi:hypothetical protein